MDGTYAQINGFVDFLASSECAMHEIELVKWAAASSLVQQPLDFGSMHRTIKQAIKLYDSSLTTPLKLFIVNTLNTSSLPPASKGDFCYIWSQ
jgi:hypothetical protein